MIYFNGDKYKCTINVMQKSQEVTDMEFSLRILVNQC